MNTLRKEFNDALVCINEITIKNIWNKTVTKTFDEYMKIPNVSPAYDTQWSEHGYIEDVVMLFYMWANKYKPQHSQVYIQRIDGRTPLIIIEIDAYRYEHNDTVLMYGHLDKQPPMTGWNEGIEPFDATYIDEKIYGRGSADDGYALFSAVLGLTQLEENNIPHARTVIVIEASEESGSPDLPSHLDILDGTLEIPLGDVSLVVCLDSGCLDYKHLWITQSLRGLLQLNVSIRVLEQGTHSGGAGGIVPSATHILRLLLDRICESGTGRILIDDLYCDIPKEIYASARQTGELLQSVESFGLPFSAGVLPLHENISDQIIANTYQPVLEIIGIEGIPPLEEAGNVLRPEVTLELSFRLPPKVDPQHAATVITQELTKEIPFNAQVNIVIDSLAQGWATPEVPEWLKDSFQVVSKHYFGSSAQYMGEGGTIPFMSILGEKYPDSQFMITGVLGPRSNAHGPNEFLDLEYMYKVTACVSAVIASHAIHLQDG